MKRRVKRVICSLLVAMIVLGIVLPIFPEGILSVEADGKITRVNELTPVYVFSNRLKTFNLHTQGKGNSINGANLFLAGASIILAANSSTVDEFKFYDNELDTLSKIWDPGNNASDPVVAFNKAVTSVPIKGDDNGFNFEYYIKQTDGKVNNWYYDKDDMTCTSYVNAVNGLPSDLEMLDSGKFCKDLDEVYVVYTYVVCFSEELQNYFYFFALFTDNQEVTDWDVFSYGILQSKDLYGTCFEIYDDDFDDEYAEYANPDNNDNPSDSTYTFQMQNKYDFSSMLDKFSIEDKYSIISEDVKTGKYTNIIPEFEFFESFTECTNYNTGDAQNNKSPFVTLRFGPKECLLFTVDYTDGEECFDIRSSYAKRYKETFSDTPGTYDFTVSTAFLDFGDSGDLIGFKGDKSVYPPSVQKMANIVGKVIESITRVDIKDNDEWFKLASAYAGEVKNNNGTGVVNIHQHTALDIVPLFLVEMKERQKTWVLDGAGVDVTVKSYPDLSENDKFRLMSVALALNIDDTANNRLSNTSSEIKFENDTKRLKLCWDKNAKGTANLCVGELWESLNIYEKLVLSYSYNFIYNTRFKGNTSNKLTQVNYRNVLSLLEYDKTIAQELSKYDQVSIESIKNVVSKRDESIVNTRSVYNVARNANSLGQYIIGINLYNEASNSADATGIYSIYDSTLQGMYHLNYEWSGINESYFPSYLCSSLGIFTENITVNGKQMPLIAALIADDEEDLEIFLQFLYNLTYAFDVAAFSEGAEASGYTVDDIKAALEGDEKSPAKAELTWISESNNLAAWKSVGSTNTAKDLQLQGQDFSIGMIRSIIELHDFCEFLGILDDSGHLKIKWTPAIEEYLNLYAEYEAIFEAFRQNEYIYSMADKGETTVEEPLGKFFNIEKKQLTDNWIKGFAVSSQYVPMETNLYDATSINMIEDSDWVSDFYYKYAFYRKALYINVDNSAIVNEFVSTEKSTTRVATLSDLLNYERDIVLYIDDNFYNADDVNTVISKIDYTSVRQNTDATATEDGNVITDLTNWAAGAFSLSPQQILKTGSETYYSNTIAQNCTKLNKTDTNNPNLLSKVIDAYLISNDEILGKNGKESVLNDYEYSVKQSYGVVSAVYKSETLYNETLKAIVADNALFKSSKAICYTPGTSSSDWRSLYNYYMLANLEEQMKNDASSTLDLNAPIFCDIFGNIVTESGLVIIPAACNATLCGKYWTPYTIGWAEYYNNGNHIKEGELNDDVYTWLLGFDYESYVNGGVDADGNVVVTSTERNKSNGGGHFEIDRNGELILRTTSINSGNLSAIIQWSTLSKNSTIIKQLFFNDAYFNKGMNMYNSRIVNLVVETLRGAPIEAIDYEYEGIDGNQDISKYGVYMAYKLEEITNSLISGTNGNAIGGNAVVTMPNLAFVDGIEYIVLYVFKIVFAIAVVGLAISLYMDAVINKLGVASVGKFVITVLMVIFAITLVPNIITWSYYKANKDILKEEVGYVMMLNYCKTYDGSEIGITKVTTPETSTELFLKIDDISVDWWSIIDDVLFKDTFATVDELYDSQLDGNLMSELPDVQKKGDGLYIDVQDIYDSTKLNYMPATGVLKNTVYGTGSKASSVDTVASFTLPYYVVLEQLIANVNEYNIARDITAYSYSVGNNGNIYTYGVIGPYLTSDEFLSDGYDILGFDRILRTGTNRVCYNFAFDESDVQSMELSQWYPTEAYTIDMRKVAIENIYSYARQYVANNASLIGKVPDEVFLKVMAMQVAIECNKEFLAPYGKSIEIMNIDTRDLARFMVSDRASMYKYYSYGYARYVYEQAGGIGVIFAGFYIALLWITSFLKPLFMIIILGLLIINAIFRKVLFRKENKAIEGYLIGCMCLCITNYAYAFMLKVSLNIANTSLGSITALACAFIVQIAYIACLIGILRIEIKDWKNSGYGEFMNVGANIMAGVNHTKQLVVEKFMVKHNAAYGDTQQSRRAEYSIDEPTVDDMLDRDAEREMNAADNPV